jgi:osmotically-inducible protein OsmY
VVQAASAVPPPVTRTADAAPGVKDSDITHAIELELARDPGIDATSLHAKTTDGVVELTGSADNLLTARRALRLAETIKGVRSVSDRIELRVNARPDAEVQRDVQAALGSNAATDSFPITVKANTGVVTLTGTVHSHEEAKMAERLSESTRGVKAVRDELVVAPRAPRPDGEILTDVRARFRWDRLLDDGLLTVAVKDANVTLRGLVGSAAEKRRAEREAWVNGVGGVDASGVKVEWWAKRDELLRTKVAKPTDAEIAAAIRAAAALDPRVETAGLKVSVESGVAYLRGTVESMQATHAAQSLARNTVGVVDVKNELAVEPQKPVSDSAISLRVTNALAADPALETFGLKASSKSGTVTLTGTVESAFERAEANAVTAGIRGVRRIEDQLAVKRPEIAYVYDLYLDPYEPFIESTHDVPAQPLAPDAEIASRIRADLAFSPFVDANQVNVSVNDGTATLTGSVASHGEAALATQDAFAGGAIAVENRLRVTPPGG